MNTLTVSDLISQLSQANPDARVVFKIECEDKNFDARLEFSRVTCLSPATEVVVTMADNTEDVRASLSSSEQEAEDFRHDLREVERKVKSIIADGEAEKWKADRIIRELKRL